VKRLTIHWASGRADLHHRQATAQPYEYVQALVAGALGIDYLTVYYILTVAFIGFCAPLAIFLLLSHFTEDSLRTCSQAGGR
jgi:hypothetical protein